MKHSGAAGLLAALVAITIWWNWPDWGRWEYWFPPDRTITRATCSRGQLTTMSPADTGGGLASVALSPEVALLAFKKPTDPLDIGPSGRIDLSQILSEANRFSLLVDQGHIVRVPEKKLVRYTRPSEFANWIVEVEVPRRGEEALQGFVFWEDLDCFKLW